MVSLRLWHERMGHVHHEELQEMCGAQSTTDYDVTELLKTRQNYSGYTVSNLNLQCLHCKPVKFGPNHPHPLFRVPAVNRGDNPLSF